MTLAQKLSKIDTLKKQLDAARPLPPELLKNLHEWYKIELTYTSNALEGNTLTASETAIVVEKGITIAGKSVTEHLEAINHAHAFDYIVELAQKKEPFSLSEIYTIHSLILRGIDSDNAGKLRRVKVKVSGSDYKFLEPYLLENALHDFITALYASHGHPLIQAAQAHLQLVTIHPFIDGNGRTARLLMNLLVIQNGYIPIIIRPEQRMQYIDAIQQAQKNNNAESFEMFIVDAALASLEEYIQHIGA